MKKVMELSIKPSSSSIATILKFQSRREYESKILPFLKYILNIGIINLFFTRSAFKHIDALVERYSDETPTFQIKSLDFEASRKAMLFFLWNCDEKVMTSIRTSAKKFSNFPIDKILSFPTVINARRLEIYHAFDMRILCAVIEKWLEIDVEIGTTIIVHKTGRFDDFLDYFYERLEIPSKNDDIMLQMDCPNKRILVKARDMDMFDQMGICSCQVIHVDSFIE